MKLLVLRVYIFVSANATKLLYKVTIPVCFMHQSSICWGSTYPRTDLLWPWLSKACFLSGPLVTPSIGGGSWVDPTSIRDGIMIGHAAWEWVGNDCPRDDRERRRGAGDTARLKTGNLHALGLHLNSSLVQWQFIWSFHPKAPFGRPDTLFRGGIHLPGSPRGKNGKQG